MASRIYTGLAGLPVVKDPLRDLVKYYGKILRGLESLPKESAYRKITANFINERKLLAESMTKPEELEQKLGAKSCEELIEHAKLELKLIETMDRYKPWEPLTEKPPENQWKWPL